MAVRWLVPLATTDMVAQVGTSALSLLTTVVAKLTAGELPEAVVPFLSAVFLVAVDKGSGQPRPVTIGNVLRRLSSKVLMPAAIAATSSCLAPEQVANGVASGGGRQLCISCVR